jgi:hypothetical protein
MISSVDTGQSSLPKIVVAGLDPAIHLPEESLLMDARVKPAHDEGGHWQ